MKNTKSPSKKPSQQNSNDEIKIIYQAQQTFPSVSDQEEYGYEIIPTNNERIETNQSGNANPNFNNLIEKLKLKVSDQAKRLTDLQLYKALCEKHILQFMPTHSLPITENDVLNFDKNSLDFSEEKNKLTEALRAQTLINEEQRNYIEILKQTIEQGILKNGITPYIPKGQDPLDFIIDLGKYQSENEKIKKNLIMEQAVLNDIKNEIENYKKSNDDYEIKNAKLSEMLTNLRKENSDLEYQNNALKNLREGDESQINKLMSENKAQKEFINQYNSKVQQYEAQILQLKTIQQDYNQKDIQLNDLRRQNSIDVDNYKKVKKDYDDLINELRELKMNNEILVKERTELTDKLSECKNIHEVVKDEKDKIESSMKITEKNLHELQTVIADKDNEITQLKSLVHQKQNEEYALKKNISDIRSQYDVSQKEIENKMNFTMQNYRNISIENEQVKYLLEEKKKENISLQNEINSLKLELVNKDAETNLFKSENENLKERVNQLKHQCNDGVNMNSDLNAKLSIMKSESLNNSKEVSFWKTKYQNDMEEKKKEISSLKNIVDRLNHEIEDVKRSEKKISNDLLLKDEEIMNYSNREKRLRKEFEELKQNNTTINKTLEKNLKDLHREVHTSYDINSKNSELVLKINELNIEINRYKNENLILEEMNQSLTNEVEGLRELNKEREIQAYSVTTNQNNHMKIIDSCFNIMIDFLNKCNELKGNNIYVKAVEEYRESFDIFARSDSGKTVIEKMKQIEDFLIFITTQIEILYHMYTIN